MATSEGISRKQRPGILTALLGGSCPALAKLKVSGGDVLRQSLLKALNLACPNFSKVPGMASWKIKKVRHRCGI